MAVEPKQTIFDSNKLFLLTFVVVAGWLFHLLSPVLMPFFVAALFAYLGDPLVDMLEEKKLSRTLAVSLVFAVLVLVGLVLLLVLVPMLTSQMASLVKKLPEYLSFIQQNAEPWLVSLGLPASLSDTSAIKQSISQYWGEVGQVASGLFNYLVNSGTALLQLFANLVLIPVVTFYLLRDWDILVARFRELIPRRYSKRVIALSLECDEMLAAFLRGQVMVMAALSAIYATGLALIGLELALLLGVIAGIVSFVPYLGLIVGIGLAGLAAFFQFQDWLPIVMVAGVFGVAQMIEGMVLTPRFVGERIGLHPVAVIFAVLAGGQLFGFAGVLLALPVAAVIMVVLRHAHQRYIGSQLYS
jgi:predicted PurR-regulated permease PerM